MAHHACICYSWSGLSDQAGEARANELVESLRAERNKQTEWAHSMQAMATEAKVSEAETRARMTGMIESLQASLYVEELRLDHWVKSHA